MTRLVRSSASRRAALLLLAGCGPGAPAAPEAPPFLPASITADEEGSCAISTAGDVACWGDDCHGAPFDGVFDLVCSAPRAAPGAKDVVVFASGSRARPDCMLLRDGSVRCNAGRGGDHAYARVPLEPAVDLASAGAFACATLRTGRVACFAFDVRATDATLLGSRAPVTLDGPRDVVALAPGTGFMCARGKEGEVWCWNGRQEIAAPVPRLDLPPVRLFAVGRARAYHDISHLLPDLRVRDWGGGERLCAVFEDGAAKCWHGDGTHDELGFRCTTKPCERGFHEVPPIAFPSGVDGRQIASLSLGLWHGCALLRDGRGFCWGDNGVGQLGKPPGGTSLPVEAPVRDLAQLVAGNGHTCALTKQREVFCWGKNDQGQLGQGARSKTPSHAPMRVEL